MRKEENGEVERNAERVNYHEQNDQRKYLFVDADVALHGWIGIERRATVPAFHAIEVFNVNVYELHVRPTHKKEEGAVHCPSKNFRLVWGFYRQEALLHANLLASTSSTYFFFFFFSSDDIIFIFISVVLVGSSGFLLLFAVETLDARIFQSGILILFEYNSKASTNWRVHVRQKDFVV